MLWTLVITLLVIWLLNLSFHIGGGVINTLLVIGLVILVVNLLTGRRSAI